MTVRGAPVGLVFLLLAGCSAVGSDPGGECLYGGVVHEAGTTFPAGDGCNTCACGASGEVACTQAACDRGPVCTYGGRNYGPGETFPSTDGCNACVCDTKGDVACDDRACPVDPGPTCMLDATYDFGPIGGRVAYVVRASLTADGRFVYTEKEQSSTITELPASCDPALPTCNTPAAIDLADIAADLADADVQLGFKATTPPIYGRDSRPVDGQVFEIKRATGGTLFVGDECPSPILSSCRPIPPGVAKLAADLRGLIEQQIVDPSCSFAKRGGSR
jgi:hypothetical protein